MPVDMRAKPYYLDDEAVQWVEDTIASMSLEEKIGQLFFNMGSSRTEEYLKMTVDKYHIGGIRYNPGTAAEVHEQNRILQENSKIPLIIACNTENGSAARPSTSPATAWMTVTSMLPTASTPFPARNGTPPSAKSTQTSSTTGWRPSWPDISCFQAIPVP